MQGRRGAAERMGENQARFTGRFSRAIIAAVAPSPVQDRAVCSSASPTSTMCFSHRHFLHIHKGNSLKTVTSFTFFEGLRRLGFACGCASWQSPALLSREFCFMCIMLLVFPLPPPPSPRVCLLHLPHLVLIGFVSTLGQGLSDL